jgi:uncharacterized membrane protein
MNQNAMLAIVTALASLAIALTIQQQDVAAFNDKNNNFVFNSHSHTSCETGSCTGNDGRVSNDKDTHSNDNFNSNRPEPQKFHSHDNPNNDM